MAYDDNEIEKVISRIKTYLSDKNVELIQKAHKLALEDKNASFTDDCGLILKYNLAPIHIVEGDEINLKITQKDDLEVIKNVLAKRNKNG